MAKNPSSSTKQCDSSVTFRMVAKKDTQWKACLKVRGGIINIYLDIGVNYVIVEVVCNYAGTTCCWYRFVSLWTGGF